MLFTITSKMLKDGSIVETSISADNNGTHKSSASIVSYMLMLSDVIKVSADTSCCEWNKANALTK